MVLKICEALEIWNVDRGHALLARRLLGLDAQCGEWSLRTLVRSKHGACSELLLASSRSAGSLSINTSLGVRCRDGTKTERPIDTKVDHSTDIEAVRLIDTIVGKFCKVLNHTVTKWCSA